VIDRFTDNARSAAVRSGRLSVTVALVMGADPVDLAAPTIHLLIGAICRADVLAPT
jgi:hypothetical protein